jgi:ankyrin repeat protein
MSRDFPVRPNLEQLKHQAKDLLRDLRAGKPEAISDLREFHPHPPEPGEAKLADAQTTLARSYGLPSWTRLVQACRMTDAIWRGDANTVGELIRKHPNLLHQNARGVESNWGPPMSYAANLGKDEIIRMLRELGAGDLDRAFGRATLQGRIETARMLHAMGAKPAPDEVLGPCETLSPTGLAFALDIGCPFADKHGDRLAPMAMLLETYSRWPQGKQQCLEVVNERVMPLPDTPVLALLRGRIDLLEAHLHRDPALFSRTFTHEEIYPPSLGCHADHSLALHGTPLAGATLLHLAVDEDALEIARWMIAKGADVNAPAAIDADGFGGHTALFGCVVSQPYCCGRDRDAAMARLLLAHGADTTVRASLRKRLRFVDDETEHVYRDVTALEWGERFHDQDWVNREAMRLIAEAA